MTKTQKNLPTGIKGGHLDSVELDGVHAVNVGPILQADSVGRLSATEVTQTTDKNRVGGVMYFKRLAVDSNPPTALEPALSESRRIKGKSSASIPALPWKREATS